MAISDPALLGRLATLQGLDVGVENLDFHLAALATLRQLGVAKRIDARIPPADPGPQSAIAAALGMPEPKPGPSVGQCAEAILLNLLSGRVALYKMAPWLQRLPCALFWGKDASPEQFTDDRLARALDALHAADLDSVYAEFFSQLVRVHDVPTDRLHSDGSSFTVHGAYALSDDEEGPRPMFGHSKEGHSAFQLVLGSTVQQHGIPVVFDIQNGNTSDPIIYREHLERVGSRLRDPNDTDFVGDCKLFDATTLGALRDKNLHAVTLMPKTFSAHEELLDQALVLGPPSGWPILLEREARTQGEEDEPLVYRGVALTTKVALQKTIVKGKNQMPSVRKWTETWAAIVLHSSELAQVHQSAQDKQIKREQTQLQTELRTLEKLRFTTPEKADGATQVWMERMKRKVKTWYLSLRVVEDRKKVRRAGPGRPRVGERPPEEVSYRVVATLHPDAEGREQDARHHGLFILVSSRPVSETRSPRRVLEIYREQTEVESGFRWLKAPAQLAPILLHKPHRIAALGLLFAMALGLYRTLQMRARRTLAQAGEMVAGHHNRPTARPSLEFLMGKFLHLTRISLRLQEQLVGETRGLTNEHRRLLELLGLPPALYDDPQILNSL
jgi:transposase